MITTIDPNLESLVMGTMIQVIGLIMMLISLPVVVWSSIILYKLNYYRRQFNSSVDSGKYPDQEIIDGLTYYNKSAKRLNCIIGTDRLVKYLVDKKLVNVR